MNLIGKVAPDFTAGAILGDGKIVDDFNLRSYAGGRALVVFFWPMDFTFVCPSELIAFNNRRHEFERRDVKIVGISSDSVFVHRAWRLTPPSSGGVGEIRYPMVSDMRRDIMRSYGVEHFTVGVALRGSFLVDRKSIVRHQSVNDLPLGRNVDEIIRLIDAMQFHEEHGEVCPVHWKRGDRGIEPSPEGIADYLSSNLSRL